MTSREQFEQKIQHAYGEDYLVVNDDGDYVNWITFDLWEFWVASRAEIEVMLPDCDKFETTRQYQDAAEMLIEMEGLKVKK